jgi:hypothetical protein
VVKALANTVPRVKPGGVLITWSGQKKARESLAWQIKSCLRKIGVKTLAGAAQIDPEDKIEWNGGGRSLLLRILRYRQ